MSHDLGYSGCSVMPVRKTPNSREKWAQIRATYKLAQNKLQFYYLRLWFVWLDANGSFPLSVLVNIQGGPNPRVSVKAFYFSVGGLLVRSIPCARRALYRRIQRHAEYGAGRFVRHRICATVDHPEPSADQHRQRIWQGGYHESSRPD